MIFHQSHSFLAISQHLRDKIFTLNSQHSMFLLPFLTLEYPLIIETHLIFFQKQCYSLIKKSYAPNDPSIPKPLTYDHQPKKIKFFVRHKHKCWAQRKNLHPSIIACKNLYGDSMWNIFAFLENARFIVVFIYS